MSNASHAASGAAARPVSSMGWVLQAAAVTAPLVSIYAPLFMAPLLMIVMLGIVVSALRERRRIALRGRSLLIALGLLVVWGALSSLWSVYPTGSLTTALQLLALFASGAVVMGGIASLDGADATRVGRALVIGMTVALMIYGIEITLNSPIQSLLRARTDALETIYSPFNRGLAVMVLLLPAAVLALRRAGHWRAAIGLAIATVLIVYVYYGSSIAVAVACGILGGTLTFVGRGAMTRLMGWLVAALVLIAPFVAREAITPSLRDTISERVANVSVTHRFVIWHFVGDKALERPMRGWGLDAARSFPDGKTTVSIPAQLCPTPPCSQDVEQLPLHPHNMALQWWLELGLPGAALGAAVLFWLFHLIPRVALDRTEQGLLAGQLIAGIVISGLSYGAWQSWWLATIMLAMGFSAVALRAVPTAVTAPQSGIKP